MACSILGSAAIVSTGFAAWVITINNSDSVTGQIDVETVEDETITLSAATISAPIVFGAADKTLSDDLAPYSWLSARNGGCNLTATINVTVDAGANFCTGFAVTVEEINAQGTVIQDGPYAKAFAAGYVAALPEAQVSYTANASSGTVTLTFEWGTYFEGLNPTDFYNKHDHSDIKTGTTTYSQDAVNVIQSATFQNLNNAQFKVTIAPTR